MSAQPTRTGSGLGELRFEEWYDTPIFEPDRVERMEEMATSGWGPGRLVAAVWLRISARASQLGHPTGPPPARKNAGVSRRSLRARPGIQGRISQALDRWADQEAASQVRLERIVLPRRWQL